MSTPPHNPFLDMIALGTVLAVRVPMLAGTGNWTDKQRTTETMLMVSEKVEAATEGAIAVQSFWMNMALSAWSKPVGPEAMADAMDAFMAPGRKTLHANAKRLGKRR